MNAQELIQLMTLINALAPAGIALVKQLATQLQGKTDEELKAMGDAIDDAGIKAAQEELRKLDNPPQG